LYVLGIEAATSVASVAVVWEDTLLAERMVNNQRTHSVNLIPMVKAVLEDAGVAPARLGGIAASIGPGSFTGLRIGLSTAKTLAQVWKIPVAGIGTLETLAYLLAGKSGLVCPVINARKNEVYAAVYEDGLKCITGPAAMEPVELARQLRQMKLPVTLLGDGVFIYQELFQEWLADQAFFAPGELSLPRGASVAGLGWRRLRAGEGVVPFLLRPLYIRMPEAEVKWLQKQRTGG
jgi:tRNA threonylcarbamoyladenosine biosynthesis protein TsaB